MKGLLIKDLKLMKNQKAFLVVVAAVCIFFLWEGRDPVFVFAYISAMLSLLVISTISYDELESGLGFLLTLPITRVKYALEKYVFGMLVAFLTIVAGSVLVLAVGAAKSVYYGPQEYFTIVFSALVVSVLIMSVAIPLQLKFGAEKSRIAMLAGIGILGILAYGMKQISQMFGMDFTAAAKAVTSASPAVVGACVSVCALVFLGISCAVSVIVMKRKQF